MANMWEASEWNNIVTEYKPVDIRGISLPAAGKPRHNGLRMAMPAARSIRKRDPCLASGYYSDKNFLPSIMCY